MSSNYYLCILFVVAEYWQGLSFSLVCEWLVYQYVKCPIDLLKFP